MANKKSDRHKGVPFQLRLPEFLMQQLEALAERNYTTRTSELLTALKRHLAENGFAIHKPDKGKRSGAKEGGDA